MTSGQNVKSPGFVNYLASSHRLAFRCGCFPIYPWTGHNRTDASHLALVTLHAAWV